MTGCIVLRNEIYYVRLTYYDKDRNRKEKWVSTGLSGKGTKQKARLLRNHSNFVTQVATQRYLIKQKRAIRIVKIPWHALSKSCAIRLEIR